MSLIRGGASSTFPCPVCFAKDKELSDLSKTWPLRTAAHSHQLIEQARGLAHAKEREKLLSNYGLRNIDVSVTPVSFPSLIDFCGIVERILALAIHRPTSCVVF